MNATEAPEAEDSAIRHLREKGVTALADHFEQYRNRLRFSVRGRISRQLKGRLDESDILQETYVTAAHRLEEYLENPNMPLFVWLRFLAHQNLTARSRENFDVKKRDPNREIETGAGVMDQLADVLAVSAISPHSMLARSELVGHVHGVLNELSELDREILSMIYLEGLSLKEVTAALQIEWETARKRLFRAMKRLKELVEDLEKNL